MKTIIALAITFLAGAAANAQTVVPYNQWTNLAFCGGQTRLYCNGPRQNNACNIEFRNSYGCKTIKMYTNDNFYPGYYTTTMQMAQSFYVDNNKVGGWWVPKFYVYLDNDGGQPFEKLIYQFDY